MNGDGYDDPKNNTPAEDPGNDWNSDEWYEKPDNKTDDKSNSDPPSNSKSWWKPRGNGQWDEKKWGDKSKYGWKNHQKRSDVPDDRVTPISSLISSADARTLEELVFFLKVVLCVLLSGYVFVWAYFVAPAWKNRRVQAELQARAAVSPSVAVQDVKG